MALNPIVFTEEVVRSFLRYQLTAYPFADAPALANATAAVPGRDAAVAALKGPLRFARFPKPQLHSGVEHHTIDGIEVPIFGIAKTIADLFRYRRTVGINLAVEGLREALRQRKATPTAIATCAVKRGVWKIMEPYVSAMSSNG